MSASVPELWNRTFSALGISSFTQLPHSISSSVDPEEVGASRHLLLDRLDDLQTRMAQNKRPVTGEVVQDAVAVHVVLGCSLSVRIVELEWVLPPGVVGNAVREQ